MPCRAYPLSIGQPRGDCPYNNYANDLKLLYTKHLDLIREGVKIGAAKLYYQKSSKTYYLLVSLELEIPDITRELVNRVMGVDVGQRYLATAASVDN